MDSTQAIEQLVNCFTPELGLRDPLPENVLKGYKLIRSMKHEFVTADVSFNRGNANFSEPDYWHFCSEITNFKLAIDVAFLQDCIYVEIKSHCYVFPKDRKERGKKTTHEHRLYFEKPETIFAVKSALINTNPLVPSTYVDFQFTILGLVNKNHF